MLSTLYTNVLHTIYPPHGHHQPPNRNRTCHQPPRKEPCGLNQHPTRATSTTRPGHPHGAPQRPRQSTTPTTTPPLQTNTKTPRDHHRHTRRVTWTLPLPYYHAVPPTDGPASRSGGAMESGARLNPLQRPQAARPPHYHHCSQPHRDLSRYRSP